MSVLLGGLQSGSCREAVLALLRSPGAKGNEDRACCREPLPYHGSRHGECWGCWSCPAETLQWPARLGARAARVLQCLS